MSSKSQEVNKENKPKKTPHYTVDELFELAKKKIEENPAVWFFSSLVACLPVQRSTFYRIFEGHQDKMDALKELMTINKERACLSAYQKLMASDKTTDIVITLKLAGSDEIRAILNDKQNIDITTNGKDINQSITVVTPTEYKNMLNNNDILDITSG